MKLTITLFALLLNSGPTSLLPDLCDDVYLDTDGSPYTDSIGQTFPRFCEWTGPDAPIWDDTVCCDIDENGAACSEPDAGSCREGKPLYCEYGERTATGGVVCYQPFPSMCDAGLCIEAPELPPVTLAHLACCSAGGACQAISASEIAECDNAGHIAMYCSDGILYEDGTIDCNDEN